MKNNLNKKIFIVLPLIMVSFFLLILGVSYIGKGKVKEPYNQYKISNKIVELKDTNIISNETLSSEHCLDDICVKDLKIFDGDIGRIEYTIINNGSKEASNILKLNFGETYAYIAFSALQPGKSIQSKTVYHKKSYANVEDYKLENLTDEEKSKIKNY